MKRIHFSLLLCVVVFATGCPKYRPKVDFNNPSSLVAKINAHISTQRTAYDNALSSNPPDTGRARRIRNELIEDALPYIDGAYIDFITDLQAGRDRNNFLLDLVELGTAASVGISKGERSLQIIGVALTAFRGGRRSLDANFYKDTATPILISKMDGNRAKVRVTILNREKGGPDDYPLGAAISDLVDYYNAGTLVRAFTQLQQDTALITQKSEDKVLELKGVPITQEASDIFRNLSEAASSAITAMDLALDPASTDTAAKAAATKRLQKIAVALEKDSKAGEALKTAGATSKDDGPKILDALIDVRAAASMVNDNALLNLINQAIVDNK